jgi:hypothetical protein
MRGAVEGLVMQAAAKFGAVSAVALLALCVQHASADPPHRPLVPGLRQADIHNPASPRYVDMQPLGVLRRGTDHHRPTTLHVAAGVGLGHFHGLGWPWYWGAPLGWNTGCLYPGLSPGWGFGFFGWYPPLVLPAEQLYGPGVTRRMLADALVPLLPPPVLPGDVAVIRLPAAGDAAAGPAAAAQQPERPNAQEPPKVRAANAESRARALRFIDFGDRHFQQQDFRAAYERYKLAAQAAPDLVEAHLRKGQCMLALQHFDAAVRLFKHAVSFHPQWATARFSLGELYGDKPAMKEAHWESLAMQVERDPNNPDLLFLLGMQLYYDGQPQRAMQFLEQAKALGGTLVEMPQAAGAAPPADAPRDVLAF